MSLKFSVELWDQFEEVYKRVNGGKEFGNAVEDFVHKRVAIEKEYSKKLQALCKSVEKESGTLNNAWLSIKEETENIAKKHTEFADKLTFQVEEPVANFLKESRKPRGAHRDQGRKIIKDLAAAEARTTSAKSSYEKARKQQDKTKEEYEKATFNNQQSPQVEKLSKKMKLDAKAAAMADKKYSEAVDGYRSLQDKFFDEEMPAILEAFNQMEFERIARFSKALEAYVELQRGISPEIIASCDRMNSNVRTISAEQDLDNFIKEKRTGAAKPERCEYEAYNPEQGRCMKSSGPSGGGSGFSSSYTPSGNSQPSISRSAPQPVVAAAPAIRGIGKCRALYDYQSTDPNELSFSQGDIILILQKDPSGWWQGELEGRIGVFPSVDWVEEIFDGAAPAPAAAPPASVTKCRALYDYAAENSYEINVAAGEILTVEGEEEGWFCGTNSQGHYGRFPSNYVTLL